MSGIGIGSHDRGTFDWEDNLYIKKTPLKTKLTAEQAEAFAKSNSGAEVLIKDADGLFSVYKLETSEDGKTITNSDFKDDSVSLSSSDIHKKFEGGKKAYVVTSDNVIRSLEIDGIELDGANQDFIKAKLSIILEDLDGIETNSKKDLEGTISGKLTISNEFMLHSINQANKSSDWVKMDLKTRVKDQEYEIPVSVKGINVAYITLKMGEGGINAKFDQSAVVTAVQLSSLPLAMIDIERTATDMIKNELAKNLGLKVERISGNEIKLVPDFKNNNLLKQVQVGDMNLHLDEIKSDANNTSFQIDKNGDLNLTFKNTKITGSSDVNGPVAKGRDAEGTDQITAVIEANLVNDMSSAAKTTSSVKVNITEAEQADLDKRLKKLSGMGISANGNVEVNDIKVDLKRDSDGNVKVSNTEGELNIKEVNISAGPAKLRMHSSTGKLGFEEAGKKFILKAGDVSVKGSVEDPNSLITFNELGLNGTITYDKDKPTKVKIEAAENSSIKLSVDMTDKKSGAVTSINNANFRGADLEIDSATGSLTLSHNKPGSFASITRLKVGDVELKNTTFKGDLELSATTGKVELDSKELAFSGKIGDIEISSLKGSGKLIYDPRVGVTLQNTNVHASGKIGNFDISKFKAKGDIVFDNNGNLVVSKTSALEIDSRQGLSVKGDLTVSHKNGVYTFNTQSGNPLDLSYKPQGSRKALVSDLVIDGKVSYNSNNSTVSFNNGKNGLVIRRGEIADVKVKNFKLTGEMSYKDGVLTAYNSKGATTISGELAGLNIKELKSAGPVKFDTNSKILSWSKDLSLDLPDKNLKLTTSGNISFAEKEGKYILSSKDGTLSGNIGGVELNNLKLEGSLVYDPATSQLTMEGPEPGKDLKVSGNLFGKDMDITSSGTIGFNRDEAGSLKIKAENVKVNGTLDGFNFKSTEGASAEAIFSPEGKLTGIKGFKFNFEVDGINLTNRGELNSDENGYEIKIAGGLITNQEKLTNFLDKLSKNSSVPDNAKTIMTDINKYMSQVELQKLDYENLSVNLDKDFNFKGFSVTAKDLDMNIPEKGYSVKAAGSVTFEVEKDEKISITSNNTKINAKLGSTDFQDFNLNGRVTYDIKSGGIAFEGTNGEELDISGKVSGKSIALKASGKLNLTNNNGDNTFAGDNIKINGEIGGFKVESLSDASGKFTLKKDGKIDLSELKFDFKLEGVTISNKNGSVQHNDDGYEIKFTGDINTEPGTLMKFIDKLSTDKATPGTTKEYINQVRKTLKEYEIYGELKDTKYNDFTIQLDKNFNVKDYSANIKGSLQNANLTLNVTGKPHKFKMDKIDLNLNIDSKADEFNIKNGNIAFGLTPQLRDSIKQQSVDLMEKKIGLKNVDLEVLQNGNVKVKSATFEGLPIADVEVKATTKFQGTNLVVSLDDVEVKGFMGVIAGIAEGIGALDPEKRGAEEAAKRIENMKLHYHKDENMIAIDLQEILYQHISEDVTLNNMNISDQGRVSVDFGVNIGGQKPFNPAVVNKNVNEIRTLLKKDTSNQNAATLTKLLVNSSPADLSRTLDRVTLAPVRDKLKKDENVLAVMEKLAVNTQVGKNSLHLSELMTFADDDMSFDLQKKLSDSQVNNLSPDVKVQMLNHMFKGHTTGSEESAIKRVVINSTPEDLSKILDKVSLSRLEDELDDDEQEAILKKLVDSARVGNNETHLKNFSKIINDDVTYGLLRKLSNEQIGKMSLTTRFNLVENLMEGKTNGDEEQTIKRIFLASEKQDIMKLIDAVTLKRLRDELESKDVTEILRVANK